MSDDSSKVAAELQNLDVIAGHTQRSRLWGPAAGIIWAVLIYGVPQIVCGMLISVYPMLRHWDAARATDWFNNAASAEFVYTVLVESMALGMVWALVRHYRGTWRSIGLVRPKRKDVVYALNGFFVYFITYITLTVVVSRLVSGFNANQQQNVGFHQTTGAVSLAMAFVSLVVLPPIAEEIIFRGFLYRGLRRKWNFVTAAIITSVLFALPHLIEGVGGLLWVGALDTFVLSLVLCYIREKTGRITAGMGVHALKNAIAFAALFVFHVH